MTSHEYKFVKDNFANSLCCCCYASMWLSSACCKAFSDFVVVVMCKCENIACDGHTVAKRNKSTVTKKTVHACFASNDETLIIYQHA